MRVHYVQHVPFEDAAYIGDWARQRGHTLTATRLYEDEPLPEVAQIGLLAIMGGPMNVYQHRTYPWLPREKAFLERAISAGVPTIGVCLGAQLLADVLGARVTQNAHIEIGWHVVRRTPEGAGSHVFDHVPPKFTAFHWHGDAFEVPAGATRLAESDACSNQAFEYDGHVLGLQFHLEYSVASIDKMLSHCASELVEAPFIQNRERIMAGYDRIPTTQELLIPMLDALVARRLSV